MNVISASYRTDIPAFYGEWFIRRVRDGYVRYKNPYGPQVISVSLKPADVHAIVFWSKNYVPFMRYIDEIEHSGLDFYFHYTITGQPHILEERVPNWRIAVENFRELARRYGPERIQWRYDPIVSSNMTDVRFHETTFLKLTQALENATQRCYFSFLDVYAKVARNLQPLSPNLKVYDPNSELKLQLALRLAEVANDYGITLYTCAEDFAAKEPIKRGACVDKDILDKLWPAKMRDMKLSSNRGACGCYDCRDIGAYDTCPHGCVYCYAVLHRRLALERFQQHIPERDCLVDVGGNVLPTDNNVIQPNLF